MSAEFWLYPPGVEHQAGVWSDWAVMAGDAKSWVSNHPLEDAADYPLYSRGATTAMEINDGLITWLGHLQNVLDGVATELTDVAAQGELIDLEQQAALDHESPELYEGFPQTYYGTGGLLDEDERVDYNLPVFGPPGGNGGTYWDAGPAWDNLNDLSTTVVPDDILSPSEWVWTILGWLGAHDISELTLEAFGGRWGDLYEFTNTLRGLETMVGELNGSLTGNSAAYLNELWQGYAATSAQKYFTALGTALTDAQTAIGDAADAFESYTTGIVQQAEAIEGLLNSLTDMIILAIIAGAIGAGTSWSGIGALAGGGTAALALARAASIVWEIRGKLQELELLYDIIVSLGNSYTTLTDFTTQIPVPAMEEAS